MAELEVDMVLFRTDTTAFTDFQGHRSRYDVAGRKILGSRRVTLHEPFTLRVEEVTTLSAGSLSDQAASTVDTSRVELDELQILVGKTRASNHSHTVTSAGVGRCAAEVGTSVATSGQYSVLGNESVDGSVFLVVCDNTLADAVLHD